MNELKHLLAHGSVYDMTTISLFTSHTTASEYTLLVLASHNLMVATYSDKHLSLFLNPQDTQWVTTDPTGGKKRACIDKQQFEFVS